MVSGSNKQLRLAEIVENAIPGITKIQAAQHIEACLICLDYHKHPSSVEFIIKNDAEQKVSLRWDEAVNEQMRRSWRDLQEATEYGAAAIAILLVIKYTEYTIIERSVKGTGFDYWLLEAQRYDEETLLPKGTARLEISGILHAVKDSEIHARINDKKRQTNVSDKTLLPALIIVVEFSRPEAHMVLKP